MRIWNRSNFFVSSRGLIFSSLLAIYADVPTAFANAGGDCHFHGKKEASEETLVKCSLFHRERLAKKGAISSGWNSLKHDSLTKVKASKGREEWQMIFNNPAPTDITQKKLYMFFSLNGNFLAANHTGN